MMHTPHNRLATFQLLHDASNGFNRYGSGHTWEVLARSDARIPHRPTVTRVISQQRLHRT
jgi:hypothetical protein